MKLLVEEEEESQGKKVERKKGKTKQEHILCGQLPAKLRMIGLNTLSTCLPRSIPEALLNVRANKSWNTRRRALRPKKWDFVTDLRNCIHLQNSYSPMLVENLAWNCFLDVTDGWKLYSLGNRPSLAGVKVGRIIEAEIQRKNFCSAVRSLKILGSALHSVV